MDAEADLLVRARPVGAQALVARRPGRAAVVGLEQADALDDRPEVRRRRRASGMSAEMPRWPGGWFAGSSQASLPGWPASVVSSDQRLAAVACSRRCPAPRRRRGRARRATASDETFDTLRVAAVAVGEAFARERPGLAEVAAAPDRRPVPFARGGRVDGAGEPGRGRRGRRASSRRAGRAGSSRGGRGRSRAGRRPCGCRSAAASVASLSHLRSIASKTDPGGGKSSVEVQLAERQEDRLAEGRVRRDHVEEHLDRHLGADRERELLQPLAGLGPDRDGARERRAVRDRRRP